MRLVVRKDCIDKAKTMPVLLDYFARHDPAELAAIVQIPITHRLD